MARKSNRNLLQKFGEQVQDNPNKRAGWFASKLGTDNKGVQRLLPQMEDEGLLLSEDDQGRLQWYGKRK